MIEQSSEPTVAEKPGGVGCLFVILGINAILIGLLAFSFSQGPYSSREQEVWYRYGSIAFLLAGVILPGVVSCLGSARSQRVMTALIIWMISILMVCVAYALSSSGGV